jgi:hypothetical protein
MDSQALPSTPPQRIDLTQAGDVAFWCRVFDVTMEQLRDAVHHAGHQVPEVRRYLCAKSSPSSR